MTNNNLIFFEGAEIAETRSGKYYRVVLEDEECTVYVNTMIAEEISSEVNEEKSLIAVLLAYIEYIRKSNSTKERKNSRMDKDRIISSTISLITAYPTEILIGYIKNLKWHEVKAIFKSANPVKELKQSI